MARAPPASEGGRNGLLLRVVVFKQSISRSTKGHLWNGMIVRCSFWVPCNAHVNAQMCMVMQPTFTLWAPCNKHVYLQIAPCMSMHGCVHGRRHRHVVTPRHL